MDKNTLKIELRAYPISAETRVLEYRVSPNQELTQEIEKKYLFGLIKIKKRKKIDTSWIRPKRSLKLEFLEFDDYTNWCDISCDGQYELNRFKTKLKTLKDMEEFLNNEKDKAYEEWIKKREIYLKNINTILY